jgi:4-hydroxy-tetrahydrodipicolinate reductase
MRTKNEKIRIGLFGFGRTGATVAREMIDAPNSELVWIVRKSNEHAGEYASRLHGFDHDEGLIYGLDQADEAFFDQNPVDVLIDFSASETVWRYKPAAAHGTRILSAISNYARDDLAELKKLSRKTAVLYSPNITIGVNLLLLTALVVRHVIPQADVAILEEHFSQKQDVSGTALRIAKRLKVDPSQSVKSIRAGGIVGKHEVLFGLPNQTLRLTHECITRGAFGRGALAGAEWLMACPRGYYTMEQLLANRFREALASLKDRRGR